MLTPQATTTIDRKHSKNSNLREGVGPYGGATTQLSSAAVYLVTVLVQA